jgi:hypothetical protein
LAETEEFARSITQGKQCWNGSTEEESIDTLSIIEAILETPRSDGWIDLR